MRCKGLIADNDFLLNTYKRSFRGHDLVSVMCEGGTCPSTEAAVVLGRQLQAAGLIVPITAEQRFGNRQHLFRFACDQLQANPAMEPILGSAVALQYVGFSRRRPPIALPPVAAMATTVPTALAGIAPVSMLPPPPQHRDDITVGRSKGGRAAPPGALGPGLLSSSLPVSSLPRPIAAGGGGRVDDGPDCPRDIAAASGSQSVSSVSPGGDSFYSMPSASNSLAGSFASPVRGAVAGHTRRPSLGTSVPISPLHHSSAVVEEEDPRPHDEGEQTKAPERKQQQQQSVDGAGLDDSHASSQDTANTTPVDVLAIAGQPPQPTPLAGDRDDSVRPRLMPAREPQLSSFGSALPYGMIVDNVLVGTEDPFIGLQVCGHTNPSFPMHAYSSSPAHSHTCMHAPNSPPPTHARIYSLTNTLTH